MICTIGDHEFSDEENRDVVSLQDAIANGESDTVRGWKTNVFESIRAFVGEERVQDFLDKKGKLDFCFEHFMMVLIAGSAMTWGEKVEDPSIPLPTVDVGRWN